MVKFACLTKLSEEPNPLAQNTEVAEEFGVTESAIRYWYHKLGITRKKVQATYAEANEDLKEEFIEQIAEIDASKREYINKCVNVGSPQTASAIFSRYLANIQTVCMSKMAVYSPNIGNNDDDTVMMQYAV